MKRIIVLALIIAASLMLACKDTMDDTMYHTDYETGAWGQTMWNRATFAR
jgi:hypothetical protein